MAESSRLSAGADPSGHVLMYAPNPVEPGSSVSHWDTSLAGLGPGFEDELMEPFVSSVPVQQPGLAFEAMLDIGWGQGGSCGNGIIEGAEECDGIDFGGLTCNEFGCSTGGLVCTATCTIDSSGCSDCDICIPTHNKEKGPRCSDGIDNDCDGLTDGADPDC